MKTNLKEAQRNEAIARLEYLKSVGLEPTPVAEFKADGTLNYTERISFGGMPAGILYWTSNVDEIEQAIRKFEAEHNAVVYHATHEYTNFGSLLDLLYVSDEPSGWKREFEELKKGYPFCYVANLDEPLFSEFGAIQVKTAFGGLVRLA